MTFIIILTFCFLPMQLLLRSRVLHFFNSTYNRRLPRPPSHRTRSSGAFFSSIFYGHRSSSSSTTDNVLFLCAVQRVIDVRKMTIFTTVMRWGDEKNDKKKKKQRLVSVIGFNFQSIRSGNEDNSGSPPVLSNKSFVSWDDFNSLVPSTKSGGHNWLEPVELILYRQRH